MTTRRQPVHTEGVEVQDQNSVCMQVSSRRPLKGLSCLRPFLRMSYADRQSDNQTVAVTAGVHRCVAAFLYMQAPFCFQHIGCSCLGGCLIHNSDVEQASRCPSSDVEPSLLDSVMTVVTVGHRASYTDQGPVQASEQEHLRLMLIRPTSLEVHVTERFVK